MKHPLLAILSAGALVVLSACSGAGSSVGADSSAGSVDAKQACSAWELGKEQTIDGVRVSFEAAAASAVLAAGADPDRWSALAADLAEIYPLATNPSSSTTDRLLELTEKIDASCAGYETWQGAATTPAAAAAAPTSVPAESAQPAPPALTVDDLLLAQITDDQLDYINGGPLKIHFNEDELLQPGDKGWGPMKDAWKVTPKQCADVIAPLGYFSPAVFDALDPQGEATRTVVRDYINSPSGELSLLSTRAFLTTPEAAQRFVDSVEKGLPACAGGKYNSGGATSSIDEGLRPSGAALLYPFITNDDSESLSVLEPIGSIVFFQFISGEGSAVERGIDTYNEIADTLAAAQGITRDPVTLDGLAAAGPSTDSTTGSDLPAGVTQELADAVFGALEQDLATSCSNYATYNGQFVESMAKAASDGGGSRQDWADLIRLWLTKKC